MKEIWRNTATQCVCADNLSLTLNSWCSPGSLYRLITNMEAYIMTRSCRGVVTNRGSGRGRFLLFPVCWYLLWSLVIVEWWYPNRCAMTRLEMSTWSMPNAVHNPQLSTLPCWPGHGQFLVVSVCWYLLWSLVIVEWRHPNSCVMTLLEMPTWCILKAHHVPQLSTLPSLVQRPSNTTSQMKVAFQTTFYSPNQHDLQIQFTFFM